MCARYGLAELAVFGSTARGEASRDNDVDLLYVLAPDAQFGFTINDLEDELAQLFGRHVNLVSKKAIHRLLRDEVVAQARTLYAAGQLSEEMMSTHRGARRERYARKREFKPTTRHCRATRRDVTKRTRRCPR